MDTHCWTTSRQTMAHVVLTCTSGALQHLNSVTLVSGRLWVTSSIRVHYHNSMVVWRDETPWGWWWRSQMNQVTHRDSCHPNRQELHSQSWQTQMSSSYSPDSTTNNNTRHSPDIQSHTHTDWTNHSITDWLKCHYICVHQLLSIADLNNVHRTISGIQTLEEALALFVLVSGYVC